MGTNAVIFGGNWNEGANSGSRASNWNNSPTNSNNNIGARGVVRTFCFGLYVLGRCYGAAGRPCRLWSAIWSCFGEHLWGSDIAPSSRKANGAVGFDHA